MLATELSGFELRADMSDTLVVAISQSGTTTDTNRTVDLVRARGGRGARHRQPAQQRPHRQGRRRALHLRRSRRGDERRLDQGLLRPDRGRLPAGARHRRRGRASTRPDRGRACWPRCASCPTRWTSTLALPAGSSPRPPSASRRAAATGRSSATASTASPPRDADQALRALLQVDRLRRDRGQEAHRPLVRAADPRLRGRARAARPPTTWPRRSRSTGPTRRRRS